MNHHEETGGGALPAGPFDAWLADMRRSLRHGSAMDVPCGHCTACCRSAQFVHIAADETETLERIPSELLFAAPGRPGEHLLGYDQRGRCPLLVDTGPASAAACSIYEHRPRACRSYDCRVFAAAGLDPGADGKPAIAERTRRWQFSYRDSAERQRHQDVVDRADRGRGAVTDSARSVTELALIAVRDLGG